MTAKYLTCTAALLLSLSAGAGAAEEISSEPQERTVERTGTRIRQLEDIVVPGARKTAENAGEEAEALDEALEELLAEAEALESSPD